MDSERDSPGGEKRVHKIMAKIAGFTREVESDGALAELARTGQLMPYDPVWHPRMARWAHAVELQELVPAFAAARAALEAAVAAEAARKASRGFLGRVIDRILGR